MYTLSPCSKVSRWLFGCRNPMISPLQSQLPKTTAGVSVRLVAVSGNRVGW